MPIMMSRKTSSFYGIHPENLVFSTIWCPDLDIFDWTIHFGHINMDFFLDGLCGQIRIVRIVSINLVGYLLEYSVSCCLSDSS